MSIHRALSELCVYIMEYLSFPGVKNPPAISEDVRNMGSIPGWGRSPGGGHSKPLQYSCLENHMDRGTWWVTVHGVTESDMTEAT